MPDFGPHPEPHPDVAGYLLGGLEPNESQRFAGHLDQCDACRDELSELARISGFLADVPPVGPPPPRTGGTHLRRHRGSCQGRRGRRARSIRRHPNLPATAPPVGHRHR